MAILYYSIKRIFKCRELRLQACHTLQKITGHIPYTSFREKLARQRRNCSFLSGQQREGRQTEIRPTREGHKIPELLQEKGSLTFQV